MYLLTTKPTPWRGINVGNLQVAQLVKKFVASYRSSKFITMFTKARVYTVILNVVLLYEHKKRLFDITHRYTVKSGLSDLSGTEGRSHIWNCRIIRNTNGKAEVNIASMYELIIAL